MKKAVNAVILVLLVIAVLSVGGCRTKDESGPLQQKVTLRQAWFPWCGYAGELEAAQNYDRSNGLDLVIEKGADDIDPIKLVVSGNSDFGVGSAEYVVNASLKGADLHIIGVINYKSPTCFLALEDKGVHSFGDFKGKKVGILTGTETETVYKLLKLKGIIDPAEVTEVEVPFDLTSFIATKSYDIRPAYVYDEPVSLDAKGIKYTIVKPDEFVSLISGVYFTTGKTLRESPDKVRSFVFSVAEGWKKALGDPDSAIRLLVEYDKGVDAKKELQSLKVGAPYFEGEDSRILWASQKRLDDFASAMVTLKEAQSTNDVLKWFDLQFVHEYHQKREIAK
jgi:NitT/TauT family transport system substrate-binding protein